MPFSITEYKFGEFRGLMIYHSEKKHHIDILPSFGALLARIELFGHELVEPIENPVQLQEEHWYRNFWLMPFQNRICDGQYTFENNAYQLAVNEEERNNALHGFFSEVDMTAVNWHVDDKKVEVVMDFKYDGGIAGYPFPFKCVVKYIIDSIGKVELTYSIRNTGQSNMPFSVGWHPYFKLDGERSQWSVSNGALLHYPLNDRNLPEGNPIAYDKKIDLSADELDHCFAFKEKPYRVTLESANMMLEISQSEDLPFVQIFTPPRNSIAIEPVSSGVDAFNTGVGLQIIEANQEVSGTIQISLAIK